MGCCGSGKKAMDYEITFGDGSVRTVSTLAEVRIALAQDTAKATPGERRKAPTYRAVPRA
jgi:hypothetical protein